MRVIMARIRLDSYLSFPLLVHMLHPLEQPSTSSRNLPRPSPQAALATSSLAQTTKTMPLRSFSNTLVTNGRAFTTPTAEGSPTLPHKVSSSTSSTKMVALQNLISRLVGPLLQRLLLPPLLLFSIMLGCRPVCRRLGS